MSAFSIRLSNLTSALWSAIGGGNYEEDIAGESQGVNNYVKGMSRNNSFFTATSRAYRKGVVGTGFNIQSRTGELDFDRAFEKHIRKWSRKQGGAVKGRSNCDIHGKLFFEKAQRVMADEYAVKSGGFIIRHHFSKNFSFGYKFEIIPLQLIDVTKHSTTNRQYNGIEIDKNGEMSAIWIYTDPTKSVSTRVPYSQLTLAVNMWVDPTQYSGVSPLAGVLEALEYIDTYKISEQKGAKKIADNPIFIRSPYMKDILKAESLEYATSIGSSDTRPTFDILKDFFSLVRLDDKVVDGSFTYVSDDEELWEAGKNRESIYNDMYGNETKTASAGIGLTASSTVGAMSSSYNEALRGVQSEEEEFKIVAQELVEDVLREMVEVRLLNGLVIKGMLTPPNYWENPDKFRETVFMRREKGHIDPVKTAKAKTEDIQVNGTLSMISALAKDGTDYETHLDEQEKWDLAVLEKKKNLKKQYEDAGIIYPNAIPSTITDDDVKDDE